MRAYKERHKIGRFQDAPPAHDFAAEAQRIHVGERCEVLIEDLPSRGTVRYVGTVCGGARSRPTPTDRGTLARPDGCASGAFRGELVRVHRARKRKGGLLCRRRAGRARGP